ncbi:hypothetical protein HC026_07375 [Lactobacillus sp. LC28-10]|uniref:Transposase n=1 Tax=Secundilactobacillus angelensis TaxID=2722706 RepID=A0ABX1KZV5_9LACO|nr:hypothetical protein [Secundilactobacillus angelensis]MCH5462877.1 hypothetical protein [Secundilactobacillus angelensis]NLR18745.1 hypothetical protein [Secundilactobacillus angelensis]
MAKKTVTVDFAKLANQRAEFVKENPWLIPAGLAIQMIPLALLIHGHVKTNIYKKKLQIEREKTKQLELQLQSGHPHGRGHGHHRHHYQHDGGYRNFEPAAPKQL